MGTNTNTRSHLGRWCVPTALAIVAGIPYSHAVSLIERARDLDRAAACHHSRKRGQRRGHTGSSVLLCTSNRVFPAAGSAAYVSMGLKTQWPTLSRWLSAHHDPSVFTVIRLRGHLVTVWGGTLCDNQKGATPLRSRFGRRKVKGYWRFSV